MAWVAEAVGVSGRMGYVYCNKHESSARPPVTVIYADTVFIDEPCICDYPNCGAQVGGEERPERVQYFGDGPWPRRAD